MCVSAAPQPELLKAHPHTQNENNANIVTLHTTLTCNHTVHLHRHAHSNPHTHTLTHKLHYAHKAMRTSSIEPAVACSTISITHKTHNTSSGSVQTLLNMWVLSGVKLPWDWFIELPKSIKQQSSSIVLHKQEARINIDSFLISKWKLEDNSLTVWF